MFKIGLKRGITSHSVGKEKGISVNVYSFPPFEGSKRGILEVTINRRIMPERMLGNLKRIPTFLVFTKRRKNMLSHTFAIGPAEALLLRDALNKVIEGADIHEVQEEK